MCPLDHLKKHLSPYWEQYGIFNPYIVIDDHSYDGNHINGIIDLTDNGMALDSHSYNGPYGLDG